ncbi:MAG: ATP-binding cassette domain-containing protein [Chloroflexota bacterium]|nr:ATP-binding cassette domain-containing protein [Chloroflexota bacterium]
MISISNLQKTIGRDTVIAITSLEVKASEVVGVVGPPGSGKTTIVQILTGRTIPTAGAVRVAGLDPAESRAEIGRRAGVLFAENALYERSSARANLDFARQLHGLSSSRASEVLSRVGLVDRAEVPAGKLPYGLQRRLAFGRAILHEPRVLILDDPFAGIDPESASIIARLIAELTEGGTAVIIFSDDAAGLVHLCEMIYELERGRIVGSYSPREREKAAFPFKVPVRGADKVILVNPADILYAHSKDGRTCLHTGGEDFPLHPGGTGGEAAPERLLSRPPCLSGQPPAGQRDHPLHPRLFHPGLE